MIRFNLSITPTCVCKFNTLQHALSYIRPRAHTLNSSKFLRITCFYTPFDMGNYYLLNTMYKAVSVLNKSNIWQGIYFRSPRTRGMHIRHHLFASTLIMFKYLLFYKEWIIFTCCWHNAIKRLLYYLLIESINCESRLTGPSTLYASF